MISMEDYQKRASQLYEDTRTRWRKILQKGVPKNVNLQIGPNEVLPYTRKQFGNWLWTQIQLNAIQCPYCRAAIDVISMQMDHKTPFARGGSPALDNQQVICRRCNSIKGPLTHDEYMTLITFLDGPAAYFRQRLEGIMINGHEGKMRKFFNRPPAKKGLKVEQPRLELELGEF